MEDRWIDPASVFLEMLRDRIDLVHVPFTERGSRILFSRTAASPEAPFCIRLAERWDKQEARYGNYRLRRPIVDGLRLIAPEGEPLPVRTTTYPHLVVLSTPLGTVRLSFQDMETLHFQLPESPIGFRFQVQADTGHLDRRGGTFHGPRNTAYTFNGRLRENRIEERPDGYLEVQAVPEAGPGRAMVLNISPRLGFNRTVPPAEAVIPAAARRWHEWFAAAPPVLPRFERQYYYAWWVMRAGLLSTRYYMTREGMSPSKVHYVGVWNWDAYFHALAYRHVDIRLAEDQLRLLLDHQREDGMIPDAVHDEGIVTHLSGPVDADVTKPPLLAWAALKLYESSGHLDFLDEIYEPLVRWNRWWFAFNDDDRDGLCQYNHPFSSGLDDSPLWDEGMPVESPDLNTYLCLQLEALAQIASLIGEKADVAKWREGAERVAREIVAQMWDEEAGLFWALRRTDSGKKCAVRVVTPFSLLPLWTGRLAPDVRRRLIAHLTDPRTFWTRYPIPTVARSDPHYAPDQMWRGPTWVNINYLFIEALKRVGEFALAQELCERTLDLILRHEDFYEYYHPESGDHPPKAAPTFGWTAAVFIDLAIQASQDRKESA
ncbi:MAG: amylo-alpha-1,6-glucosidase [Chloroflexia bacterium]